jgi:putative acetyltransferase
MICEVTQAAFEQAEYSSGTEGAIVRVLCEAGALTISVVADEEGDIVGHVAFSPIVVEGIESGWFGLGPVSVSPDRQGTGIGARLIRDGLAMLRAKGACGCVVLGDPRYYERFGFREDARLRYPGVPQEYFMAQPFGDEVPTGEVAYHPCFGAA